MELLINFFNEYGTSLLYLIVTAIAGWVGLWAKGVIEKHLNDKEKKEVVMVVVKAVKQIYKDLNGEEKLCKAIESATEILAVKGITITELELRMLIEAAYSEIKEQVLPALDPEQHVDPEIETESLPEGIGEGETYVEPPVEDDSPEMKEE